MQQNAMITTVTQDGMVAIPAEVCHKLGIRSGWKLDWQLVEGKDEILVKVIPDRGGLARQLCGLGARLAPDRDLIAELDLEREQESLER
jgi:bifunctional DNA-binding transcriptional regulator/antitoxin component of YhaV-PrlF toxin-antitoxin module